MLFIKCQNKELSLITRKDLGESKITLDLREWRELFSQNLPDIKAEKEWDLLEL